MITHERSKNEVTVGSLSTLCAKNYSSRKAQWTCMVVVFISLHKCTKATASPESRRDHGTCTVVLEVEAWSVQRASTPSKGYSSLDWTSRPLEFTTEARGLNSKRKQEAQCFPQVRDTTDLPDAPKSHGPINHSLCHKQQDSVTR